MTTAITAPQVCTKHPDEELWIEFSFAKIFKHEDEVVLQTGTVTIESDPIGLVFNLGDVIIEGKSVFVLVSGGVQLVDPETGRLKPYELLCAVDSSRDGIIKYARRVQIGRVKVAND